MNNQILKFSEIVPIARRVAVESRISVLQMTSSTKTSHIGSCFSVIDLLATLYAMKFHIDEMREDNIILSKGHAAAALYAVLHHFESLEIDLSEYCKNGSPIFGHVNHEASSNIPMSTGSLGHGLPFGLGMALGNRLKNERSRTFVILSDGELNEGTTWESALVAGHHGLSKLTVLVDRNHIQSLGFTEEIVKLDPIAEKWQAFGWETIEIDGHDFDAIAGALLLKSEKPLCIIADTLKGKGVSFMENKLEWHYKSATPSELEAAIAEIMDSY